MSWRHTREVCQSLSSFRRSRLDTELTQSPRQLISDTVFHSFGDSQCAFGKSPGPEQKEVHKHSSPGKASGSTNSGTVQLRVTICAIAHSYKLLHTPMPFHLLKWQFHQKDRIKVIPVSFPDYFQAQKGGNLHPIVKPKVRVLIRKQLNPTSPKNHPADASYHQLCTRLARLHPKFMQLEQDKKWSSGSFQFSGIEMDATHSLVLTEESFVLASVQSLSPSFSTHTN